MIQKRPSESRGRTEMGWLNARHSFSFGNYFDPEQMGFRSLRVINDDHIAPDMGFGTHPHRDVEILTFVIEGELQHRDSMGNGAILRAGELQYMRAGRGVAHSEFNPSPTTTVHLLQIWIKPRSPGGEPAYAQSSVGTTRNELILLASPREELGCVVIQQEASLSYGDFSAGKTVELPWTAGRHGWLQMIAGTGTLNGVPVEAGDGAVVQEEEVACFTAESDAKFLWFSLE